MSHIDSAKDAAKKGAKTAFAAFDPALATPEAFRAWAERGVEQAKDTYAKFRTAAEETTDLIEDTYLQATRGATQFQLKALETLRANVNANFDYAQELLATKSVAEALEVSATHLRQRFEAFSEQSKEFAALAQKVSADASEPIKTSMAKTFKV